VVLKQETTRQFNLVCPLRHDNPSALKFLIYLVTYSKEDVSLKDNQENTMQKLQIFDFDGTLVFTPTDNAKTRKLFEDETGIPWVIDKKLARKLTNRLGRPITMRKGWFGRKETLEPPLVPNPTPDEMINRSVCDLFLQSKQDENALTVMMTGRHEGLRSHVLRILNDVGLVDVKYEDGKAIQTDSDVVCYLNGNNGPAPEIVGQKPHETHPWKIWILEQLIHVGNYDLIEIWEDRKKYIKPFEEFGESIEEDFVVHFVEGN